MAQWHCSIKGQKYGPVEEDQIKRWITEGRLTVLDLVWTEGMAEWQAISSVSQLAGICVQPIPAVASSAPPLPAGSAAGGVRRRNIRGIAPGATGAMVWGIIGIFCFGVILGIIALVLGIGAKNKIKQFPDRYIGEGQATAGIVLGIIDIVLGVIGIFWWIANV
jgi:hypothetical protein